MKKLILYIVFILIIIFSCRSNEQVVLGKENENLKNKYAKILNVPEIQIKNIELYSFIDEWYGVKYRYGGLTTEGVDCSGFCNVLYFEVYNKDINRSTKDLVKSVNKINKKDLLEGDLVFFTISGRRNSHVGIYLANNKFVHASTSKGVIISSLKNPYYQKNYSQGGRFR